MKQIYLTLPQISYSSTSYIFESSDGGSQSLFILVNFDEDMITYFQQIMVDNSDRLINSELHNGENL